MIIRLLSDSLHVVREYNALEMLSDCMWINSMAVTKLLYDTKILKTRKDMLYTVSYKKTGNMVHILGARNLQHPEELLQKVRKLGDNTMYLFHVVSGSPYPVREDSVFVNSLVEKAKKYPVVIMDVLTVPCREYGYETGTMYSFALGSWCHFKPQKKSCCQ